jgi:hypothetical protein
MSRPMPRVDVKPDVVMFGGGMDLETPPMSAKPGTARLAYNYEWAVKGGLERVGGIEPYDGRPAPSAAAYVLLECAATITGVVLGDTLDGATSGASGKVIYLDGAFVALTRVTGDFEDGEDLELSAVPVATVGNANPEVDGFLDNTLNKAAADEYQADITTVPGSGRVRGLAIIDDTVYAWRDNVGATAMVIYKATAGGWTAVALNEQVAFGTGTVEFPEGSTITQGGVTATVLRVVLESGDWATSNAAGRLIISGRAGGNFSAGAATGAPAGAASLTGAQTAITLQPGGRVRTDRYAFTAQTDSTRLYGCDGVNAEFEFDGTVYAPINTGMSGLRASAVKCHKQHLFFAYRGSVQHSGIGAPYVWSPVFGASELGTGDTITNFVSVGGATDAAALMILCANSIHVLYGTSAADWELVHLSRVSGAKADSAQDIGGVVALDTPGVMRYPATQSFGNFAWDTISMAIQSATREQECACSVYVPGRFKYRLFFADGTSVSALPGKKWLWSVLDYNRSIVLAENAEIDGVARTFYADDDGWVYEADVGRSFAGESIPYALVLHPLSQGSPQLEKTYRDARLEVRAQSAATFHTSAEFNDDEEPSQEIETEQPGAGLTWDLSNYDQSYWDSARVGRFMVPCEGDGTEVAFKVMGNADDELPHTLDSLTILYTPRKLRR